MEILTSQGCVLGVVGENDCLGELMAIGNQSHTVHAVASSNGEAMLLEQEPLKELLRKRPDIGMALYQNLGKQLAIKLQKMNQSCSQSAESLERENVT